ncbi:MAG: DEAD/DEAH box helicase family protein [Candidatus Kapabacteria bacterium]|nr:DEAD/DEAH box helicase family protein [Candidatus Kapabacteria bacterium]
MSFIEETATVTTTAVHAAGGTLVQQSSIPGIRLGGSFRFRSGQEIFLRKLAEAFAAGEKNHLGVFVPGYGKTITALSSFVVAKSLGKASKVVIFVPRGNLRDQYADPKELSRVFMSIGSPPFTFCVADSDRVFLKNINTDIIITTYQYASGKGGHKALKTFCEHSPCMFIFDEVHHLSDDGTWATKISEFPHSCSVALSGTPLRADNKTLFGVPFHSNGDEQFYVALHEVSLRDAHAEGRILKHVSTHVVDYTIMLYNTKSGERVEMSLGELAAVSTEKNNLDLFFARKQLRFHDEYIRALIDPAFARFAEKRALLSSTTGGSIKRQHQLLVIAMSNKHAEAILTVIKERYPQYSSARIGQDVPEEERLRLLQEYRDGSIDVMVQVDMIGEGTDIKPISVIIKADLVRALSKTLQQVFRGMRYYDGFPEEQNVCDIYTSNDAELVKILEWLAQEEQIGLKLKQSREMKETERREVGEKERDWRLEDVQHNFTKSHELTLFSMPDDSPANYAVTNVTQREQELRTECSLLAQKLTNMLKSHGRRIEVHSVHAESKKRFGRAQEEMSINELERKKAWLDQCIKLRRLV